MRQDEAERLARRINSHECGMIEYYDNVEKLCRLILSVDMKREIENAAYERAIQQCGDVGQAGRVIAKRIRSLIQPPAQKEDGE